MADGDDALNLIGRLLDLLEKRRPLLTARPVGTPRQLHIRTGANGGAPLAAVAPNWFRSGTRGRTLPFIDEHVRVIACGDAARATVTCIVKAGRDIGVCV